MAHLEQIKNTEVKIAVIGKAGVGKSSWINKFRGIRDVHDPLYAKTSLEFKKDIQSFQFTNHSNLKLYDLPEADTDTFPLETYLEETKMHKYDACVMLTEKRILKGDIDMANLIMKTGKRLYFGITHWDVGMQDRKQALDATVLNCSKIYRLWIFVLKVLLWCSSIISNFTLDNDEDDEEDEDDEDEDADQEHGPDKTAKLEKCAEKFRVACLEAFKSHGSTLEPNYIYLLANYPTPNNSGWLPDNEKLKIQISDDLPKLKQIVLGNSIFIYKALCIHIFLEYGVIETVLQSVEIDFFLAVWEKERKHYLEDDDLEDFLLFSPLVFRQLQSLRIDWEAVYKESNPLQERKHYLDDDDLEDFLFFSPLVFCQLQSLGIDGKSIELKVDGPKTEFLAKVKEHLKVHCNDNLMFAWLQITSSKTPEETHKMMKSFAKHYLFGRIHKVRIHFFLNFNVIIAKSFNHSRNDWIN